ncbi:MAG: 2-hydroxyacyl-CoA dehydratase [Verrucomicrobia bacterium]|nr:2-hydroxyacyl-CoA dehydratase [Verrucomicrobiota bacterium]
MNTSATPSSPRWAQPGSDSDAATNPLDWFRDMLDHCYDYAEAAKREGRPIVGILCEFTPREVILAAGAVPVCLCGGSADTIPAAEQVLPANLCPLIKSTFGYHLTGRNPFLQWADLVVAETTCDGKKKMFELMAESKPLYVLELPQKADDADALTRWTDEVRKLKDHLEQRFGVRITDEGLRRAIRLMNRERGLRRRLADLMAAEHPPLTGRQLLGLKSIISGIEADLEQYAKALDVLSAPGLPEPPSARKPRVLLTGVPLVHGAERVLELIEDCGAVVVCMENCTGLKPILEDVEESVPDPLRAIARKYYHLPCSVMLANCGRLDSLRALAAKFRPDCVIELIWHACLTYDVESYHVRRLVESELRLPYLKITTDYSASDSARIKTRVEALLEMARLRGRNLALPL